MSASRRPSGPWNSGNRTWVVVASGRRPSPKATDGGADRPSSVPFVVASSVISSPRWPEHSDDRPDASCLTARVGTGPARSPVRHAHPTPLGRGRALNWRTLPAHQERCDIQDDPKHELADREDEEEQDDEAVLAQDRSPLPGQLWRQESPEEG